MYRFRRGFVPDAKGSLPLIGSRLPQEGFKSPLDFCVFLLAVA